MSPAGSAVRLITNVIDDVRALWPVGTGIEVLWKSGITDGKTVLFWKMDSPVWVNDGSHDSLELFERGSFKLLVNSCNPVGVRSVNVDLEIDWHLFSEEFENVWVFAELHSSAGSNWVVIINDLGAHGIVEVDSIKECWELIVKLEQLFVFVILCVINDSLAKFADIVVLSVEIVDFFG